MRVDGGLDDGALDLAGLRVGHVHVHREEAALGEEDDLLAVGTELGSDVQLSPAVGLGDERAAVIGGRVLGGHQGLIGALQGLLPVLRQVVDLDPQHLLQGLHRVPAVARDLQDVADDVVAETPADVGPEGLAIAVGEVFRAVELRDLGQLLPLGRVAHPHRGVGIDRPQREVLRHALDEPQGQAHGAGHAPARRSVLARDVELEGVDELVAQHVVGLGQGAGEGQDHAPLQDLGDAARPLAGRPAQDVRLLELRVAPVEDDGLSGGEGVAEHARVTRVPPLRHRRGALHRLALLRVVVDVEVVGLQHLKIESPIPDLVTAEVLGGSGGGHEEGGDDCEGRERKEESAVHAFNPPGTIVPF